MNQDVINNLPREKFCYHHQGWVSIDAGSMVMRGKIKRWICLACQEKSKSAGAGRAKSI